MSLNEEIKAGLWVGSVFLGAWMVLWVLMDDLYASFLWASGLLVLLVFLFNMAIHCAGMFRR